MAIDNCKPPFLKSAQQLAAAQTAARVPLDEPDPQQAFSTDHLLTNLKGRTVSGGFVTGIAQVAQFGLNFLSVAVLARLLSPQDFGLVSMVLTIMGFVRVFNDAGLSTATVQRDGITHAQVSNLFWTNIALGGTISLLLLVMSPVVAWFYREPRLVAITATLAITFLVSSASVQQLALLKRQMKFKHIAAIQVSAFAVGATLGIFMAWLGCGYWSLVGMQLCTLLLTFLLTWLTCHWRPQRPRRDSGTRELLGFGANLSASSFLWCIAKGSDNLLIGRAYGSASLGLYTRAGGLVTRPMEQFLGPLEAVFMPTLSRLQSQPERYRRVFLQVYEIIAVVSFPLSALLLPLSRPLILVVLGQKWQSAVPIFAGLSLVALYTPIAGATGWLLTSQRRGRDFLLQSVIGSVVTVVAFLIGLPFGPLGVAVAYSASNLLILLPVIYYIVGKEGPVTTRDLWGRFLTYLPLWGAVFGATWLTCRLVSNWTPLGQLLLCVPAAILTGGIFIWLYRPARRAVINLVAALQEWRKLR